MKKLLISTFAASSLFAVANAQTLVSSDISSDTTWGNATNPSPIILDGTIFVKNDAALTILPGTVVRGQPRFAAGTAGAPGSLVVTQSGQIFASGNASNEIIFTTAAVDNDSNGIPDDRNNDEFLDTYPGFESDGVTVSSNPIFYDADPKNAPLDTVAVGDIPGAAARGQVLLSSNNALWGGLVILGNAPTNLGGAASGIAKIGFIEGLLATSDARYGGNLPNDNSGVLRYVSVRHGGDQLGDSNEINGITLGGVGYGTTIEFCEVYNTFDDGFEFFGGTVNTNNLVVTFAGDDQFDGDQGWTGQNQFWVAVLPYDNIGDSGGDKSFEFDGTDGDKNVDFSGVVTPFPNYAIYNATTVGNSAATGVSTAQNGTIDLKSDYSGQIFNSIIVNTGASVAVSVSTGNPVTIDYCTFDDVAAGSSSVVAVAAGSNNVVNSASFSGLVGEDAAVIGGINLRPILAFVGVTSDLVVPNGYQQVSFRGAVDPNTAAGATWTANWTALSESGIQID
ncbi:MAG: hypothetical protein ACJAYS_000404 [Lentimonas sp.]|jgi:hypothetical protein